VLQQGLAYDNDNRQIEYSESIMKMERFVYVN
ncbi:MAG TPA: GntR family transcriptional regulator, partial [Erysipelotrichaceae bacterium]|nr:GntR family transcriptional regulator [Erysipelotrichaceae bacterium]